MEYVCAWTRPQFILSSEKVLGMESEPMLTPKGKSPLLEVQNIDSYDTHMDQY